MNFDAMILTVNDRKGQKDRTVPISEAASVVAEVLDKFGSETISMAYAAESANINALLQDLKPRFVIRVL